MALYNIKRCVYNLQQKKSHQFLCYCFAFDIFGYYNRIPCSVCGCCFFFVGSLVSWLQASERKEQTTNLLTSYKLFVIWQKWVSCLLHLRFIWLTLQLISLISCSLSVVQIFLFVSLLFSISLSQSLGTTCIYPTYY